MYLTENRYLETKKGMWQIIIIICVTYVQKNWMDQNFTHIVLRKIVILRT